MDATPATMRAAAGDKCAILLMGPTGAGKSDLALQAAARFPIEIVSVDSAQVYRGMDIGTAKPNSAARARVRHHLLDIRDPTETYSAGEFTCDAAKVMQDIWNRGCVPMLVGGTMLYFHALTHGIAELPARNHAVRAVIDSQAASEGWPAVHRELATVDPLAASRIGCDDSQRIQRALEVFRLTGTPITQLQQTKVSAIADVNVFEFTLAPVDRSALHLELAARFNAMLAAGLLGEVRHLFERFDLSAEHPSMRAVGYRQLWQHLAGSASLSEATERAIVATRQLAKRQLTWLRRRPAAQWLDSMHRDVASTLFRALSMSGLSQVAAG